MFPILGKAMLGIAGAYLLRALVESSAVPREAVVAIALAYAAVWLVAATRVAAKEWFASITYASTSVLILIPMLWELTLRFKILPTAVAAGVLAAFVLSASALAWNRHSQEVVSMAYASASVAALVLAISTRDLVPFIVALLVMAFVSEYAAARTHQVWARVLVTAASDAAVGALVFVYSSPESSHPGYKAISGAAPLLLGFVLLLIYGASVNSQTVLRRRPITFFETVQMLIAFLLVAWATFAFWPGTGKTLLGILCLITSMAGYAASFAWFGRAPERHNFHVYAAGCAALFLAGIFLSLPSFWIPLCLSAAAIGATILGLRTMRLELELYGLAYLAAAAFSSGLLAYVFHAIGGRFPVSPTVAASIVAACAILCYAAVGRVSGKHWKHRLLVLLSAALAVSVTAAFLLSGVVWLTAAAGVSEVSHTAVVRTLTTCAIALVLAYGGSHWQRMELVWMAYVTLVLVASKLVFEDIRQGHLGFTAASMFLYAVTLLLVPRVVRRKPRTEESGQIGLKVAQSNPR